MLIRWRNKSVVLAKLGEKLLGIAAKVPLPEATNAETLLASATEFSTLVPHPSGEARAVVLWLDSFYPVCAATSGRCTLFAAIGRSHCACGAPQFTTGSGIG